MIEIDSLIHRQLEASPMFANNFKNMYSSELREVRFDGFSYTLQMNPARIQSATADITKKPDTNRCFLCSGNLIEGQFAEDYTSAFLIAVNPFPLAENHITIILIENSGNNSDHIAFYDIVFKFFLEFLNTR